MNKEPLSPKQIRINYLLAFLLGSGLMWGYAQHTLTPDAREHEQQICEEKLTRLRSHYGYHIERCSEQNNHLIREINKCSKQRLTN